MGLARILAAGVFVAVTVTARAADKVLKFVQNGNMTILDPIWTTAYVTRTHGYFIYDTLFSMDANNEVKPQMVDKYEVSADKTLWTFTLRDGLEWHDGTPVTSEDCIPSIQRWGRRDAMGLKLMDFVAEFKAVNPKTFTMKLKEPYGLVLESLGKPSSNVPFMMPKKVAETDPFKQIDSQMGSGPFIYVNAESKPGEKHVYVKNPKYKPRSEKPSGLAGGKVVKVDRVEWIAMPDVQTQVAAIQNGEIDMIEAPGHDLLPLLAKDKNIKLLNWNPTGNQYTFRFRSAERLVEEISGIGRLTGITHYFGTDDNFFNDRATVEEAVPRWLRGKGRGWMTAEYALLPASTGERVQRAVTRGRPDGRTVEIQRLIGRALRSICDFDALGDLWLATRGGNQVFRFDLAAGKVHHVAGTGAKGYTGDGGPAKLATLNGPKGLTVASVVFHEIVEMFADAFAHSLLTHMALPINMVTTFIGAPLLIYLMFKNKHW